MFNFLTTFFNRVFGNQYQSTYGSDLDQYILSKRPSTTAEVDFWVREYDKRHMKGWI
jgi:hypothetical protein